MACGVPTAIARRLRSVGLFELRNGKTAVESARSAREQIGNGKRGHFDVCDTSFGRICDRFQRIGEQLSGKSLPRTTRLGKPSDIGGSVARKPTRSDDAGSFGI